MLGTSLKRAVGFCDGGAEGTVDGAIVVDGADGASLGASVEGADVGTLLGGRVGTSDGTTEGVVDGANAVGESDGALLGKAVGS